MIKTILPFYIIFLVLLLATFELEAQKLIVNKTVWVGADSTCFNGVYQAKTAKNGDILFTGVSSCFTDHGYVKGCPYKNGNLSIGRMDNNLVPQWIKSYGGSYDDIPQDFVEFDNGDVIVLGHTYSNDGDIKSTATSGNLWLTKFNINGDLLWEKTIGCPYHIWPNSITITHDNNLLVSAVAHGKGEDVDSVYTQSQFLADEFLVKLDTSGNILWKKIFGGTDNEFSGFLIARPNNYFFIFCSNSHDYDCLDTGWRKNKYTNSDIFVFSLDKSGNILWSKSYGGTKSENVLSAFWNNYDNSIIIEGRSESKDYTFSTIYSSPPFSQSQTNSYIMKVDSLGVMNWVKPLKSANRREILAEYGSGYIYFKDNFLGSFKGSVDISILNDSGDLLTSKTLNNNSDIIALSVINNYQDGFIVMGGGYTQPFNEGVDIKTFNGNHGGNFFSYFNYFPLSIEQMGLKKKLAVFPNPTSQSVKVSLPQHNDQSALMVIDMMGRKVYAQKISANTNTIDLNVERIVSGNYTLVLKTNEGNYYQKLVVDH